MWDKKEGKLGANNRLPFSRLGGVLFINTRARAVTTSTLQSRQVVRGGTKGRKREDYDLTGDRPRGKDDEQDDGPQ